MTLLRGLEQHEGEQMLLFFRNSPTLYITPEYLCLLVPQNLLRFPSRQRHLAEGARENKDLSADRYKQGRTEGRRILKSEVGTVTEWNVFHCSQGGSSSSFQ